MRRTYVIGLGLGAALLLGGFQNCGKLGFSTGSSSAGSSTAGTLGIAAASLGNFACGSYQALERKSDGTFEAVPARTDDGTCYYVKLFDAVADASQATSDPDLAAFANVRRLAAQSAVFTLLGERAIELSSSITLPAPVTVSNLLISGLYPAGAIPDVSSEFEVYGDSSCGTALGSAAAAQVALGGVPLSIAPITDLITVAATVDANVPYTLDVRAETCGEQGHVSDVYAIFR